MLKRLHRGDTLIRECYGAYLSSCHSSHELERHSENLAFDHYLAAAKAYQTDPSTLRQSLTNRFTPEVWNWFMKSLASNDPVTFAETLAHLEGGKADGAFVGDTLDTIQNFHNLLRTMVGDEAEAIRGGSPAPKRFIVDARHIEAAPKEWLEYLQNDQYTMEKIIHGQAFEAGFGRNGAAMDKNLATAINEQQRAADTLAGWRAEILKENPGIKEKVLQQQIKERADREGVSYTGLKAARGHLMNLNSVAQSFSAIKSMNNSGKIPELLPWARLLRSIGGWTVSGAGTALTAHSVFLEQPVRLLGLNSRSLAMTGRSVVDLGKVMANAMLQAFGREVAFESDRMLAANNAGLFDAINTNRQRWTAAWSHANVAYQSSNRVGRAVGRTADVAGAALQTDVFAPGARDKALANQAAGKPIAPTLKVLSPFHFVAECLQISNFITWQRHIETMVTGGAQHLELHPDLVDDKNFKVTREMLGGFGAGEREFNFLSQRMNDFGFSLEQLVREAHANKGTDKPILRPEVDKAIQQLTLNEITLESSLTSRMPFLQGTKQGASGLGIAMNPVLGWPLAAYLAILPVGMAVAWLRNKFDEDVLGRKQNISDLSNMKH